MLNNGETRLIGLTVPIIPEVRTSAELLAYCARVSSSANQLNHETGPKLIRSLINRKEWSPLEMVSLTFEVVTTRDIARQILRHRSFSFQEFSQRYARVDSSLVPREARLQDTKDRQNSIPLDPANPEHSNLNRWWLNAQDRLHSAASDIYASALEQGVSKEVARAVLPEGLTLSRLFIQGTLRSWVHYCMLRCEYKTQLEHRLIAEQIRDRLIREFPDLAGCFE